MNAILNTRRTARLSLAAAAITVTALGACASTPPAPTTHLQAAQQAISTAEQANAGKFSPNELGAARTRLAAANEAVTAKKMVEAERFADQSRADAELASAKTTAVQAKAVNDEMLRSTSTLVEEMKRNSGEQK
jgi:hypothetical protein